MGDSEDIIRLNDKSIVYEDPPNLNHPLKQHQKIGVKWLSERETMDPVMLEHPEYDKMQVNNQSF